MEKNKAKVAVIMGSDSDLPIMNEAVAVLNEFGVPNEVKIISAHRSPHFLSEYAESAYDKGIRVFIAGAGGAAHLPGVTAAYYPLPVIGVPVKAKSLEGMDSLLSIVQMPPGVPVATVGINMGKNAGLLAIQILASSDKELYEKMKQYKKKMAEDSLKKNEKITYSV